MSLSRIALLAGTSLSLTLAAPAVAQQSDQPLEEPALEPAPAETALTPEEEAALEEEEIVVVGQRDPNVVIGDIPPENQLNSRDIRAYGASSISELLDAVAAQTGSGRGRDGGPPVVLLNGRRISGFREIRDLPPEAILRMDILPEEVALKYGYRADQRVVNVILRPRFRSTATRVEAEDIPTEGGMIGGEADVTRLMINDNGRTSINAHVEGNTSLLESERDIALEEGEDLDPRDFRTLIGRRRLARLGGTVNRTLFGDVSSTFDGQVEWSDGRSLLGPSLISDGIALARDTDGLSGHAGIAFNGQRQDWRWSLTGNYDISRSRSFTDRENDETATAFEDLARSVNQTGSLDFVAVGPFAELPAGKANLTFRLGGDTRDLDSRTRRAGIEAETDLGRDRVSSSLNFDLPVAKRNGSLGAIGNLTFNANAEVEKLSDFGTLTTVGGGAHWSPISELSLIGSWTREEGAPSLQQLGDPVLVTPNTRIFDFVTGQTVEVDAVTGGNPGLDADKRNVFKLGGTLRPSEKVDLTLRADYVHTRIDDPISRFPGPTEAIEDAFPERFIRDQSGNLVRVDLRPVNFDRSAKDELRWGLTFTKPLRSARPSQSTIARLRQQLGAQGGTPRQRPEGAGSGERRRFGGGGGGGGRFGGGRGGRLQFTLFHTLLLKDEVRISPTGPTLDYLDGDVADTGGSRPRHRIEADAGWFNNGLGARLSANWQSGSKVDGGESGQLDFAPLTKFNLRLFANLGERLDLVTKQPWLRGTQVRLNVENIFDAKQKVRDAAGVRPINFQPDLLDPQGRTISISIRKLFLPPPRFFRRQDREQQQQQPATTTP